MVLGAGGQVGRATVRAAAAAGVPCRAFDRRTLDITDADRLTAAVARLKPAAIVNAAADADVDGAEADPGRAFAVNRDGAANVARAAAAGNALLLHLSTDYVFDGVEAGPYVEGDPVAPVNRYGESKAAGEAAVATIARRHLIVRSSWLFGPGEGNFLSAMLSLRWRGEIGVVDDQTGGPTPAAALGEVLVAMARQAAAADFADFGIYHFSGAPDVTWCGFAREIFRHVAGPRIRPIGSAEWPSAAARPANSRLDCSHIREVFGIVRPDWRVALAALLAQQAIGGGAGADNGA
ncbi:dTDP-4-dehydrorhamnose reductase [Oceanibacterium hippocampi]|uniref:dTDP-4-dehydrorhamnose reductase n=1 Tax=Oceanibacterium hippocampi TaxID=745714 RepID=A0A1Y5TYI1_9PROT|nr:dTDP-4-dehydrorhamnose reductase [Oceanibacterium hippocampi]SLN73553.1 dTDP-4-dehydrorhamnose reductase [Oceanibacterium hippocampi]